MNWKKIFISAVLAGIVMLVVWQVLGLVWGAVFPQYDALTIPGMRDIGDPIMVLFFLQPFVLALAFAIAFHFFEDTFANMTASKRGFYFGLVMWMLVTLPSMFLIYSSMNYGETFLLTGTITQLIEFVLAGITIAWVFARK